MRFSADDYSAAERFLPTKLLGAVKNAVVAPNWIGRSDWFWYRREEMDGESYILYDAATGSREKAFDRSAVAAAVERIRGEGVDAQTLGVTQLYFDDDRRHVDVVLPGAIVKYDRVTGSCVSKPDRVVKPNELLSPCRRYSAITRKHDLWLIDRVTGDERQLTFDGERNFGYGDLSDASLVAIPVQDGTLTLPPVNVVWSPDSRYLVTARIDERQVRAYPFLRSVPANGAQPVSYTLRRALIGDLEQPESHIATIDVATGAIRASVQVERVGLEADDDMLGVGTCWFDPACTTCFVPQIRDRSGIARLIAIDLVTAEKRIVFEENVEGFVNLNLAMYNVPNVRVICDGKEFIWFSERDGWGHLYLYGGDGILKRQLTRGSWVVFDILHVDEERRHIYFTGSSRIDCTNPYLRFLYRVSLEGGEPVLLTPEIADHMLDGMLQTMAILLYRRERPKCAVSPSGRFVVAAYSTLAEPPVSVVRSAEDGSVLSTVEKADTSTLDAIGYVPPEPFVVQAADGETNLHGVIYWPPKHDPTKKYPVIDALYNGFQVSVVPRNYVTGYITTNPYGALALAQLGFIVVTLDARGTALRSRSFHEHSYRNFGDAGIEDHVVALQRLSAYHYSFDLDRIGVSGYSFGGYYSARLMLKRPDIFKVGVSGAGCHNWQGMYPGYENLIGDDYVQLDNALLADDLRGKLMIFIGDMDENVPAAVNYQFVAALQRSNKDYDLLILWNATHWDSALAPYVMRKTWDHFIRNLMGAEAPDWNAQV